jgi:hypothetical protein
MTKLSARLACIFLKKGSIVNISKEVVNSSPSQDCVIFESVPLSFTLVSRAYQRFCLNILGKNLL